MHLKILAYTWKCYKWHNHTSFCDYLSLDVIEEALKNEAFVGPPGTDHITTHGLASWPKLRVTEDAHENLD